MSFHMHNDSQCYVYTVVKYIHDVYMRSTKFVHGVWCSWNLPHIIMMMIWEKTSIWYQLDSLFESFPVKTR